MPARLVATTWSVTRVDRGSGVSSGHRSRAPGVPCRDRLIEQAGYRSCGRGPQHPDWIPPHVRVSILRRRPDGRRDARARSPYAGLGARGCCTWARRWPSSPGCSFFVLSEATDRYFAWTISPRRPGRGLLAAGPGRGRGARPAGERLGARAGARGQLRHLRGAGANRPGGLYGVDRLDRRPRLAARPLPAQRAARGPL